MTEQPPAIDKEAIRTGLETTRAAYHELLASLSDADWKVKSANPAWTVGQLMWHLAEGMSFFPKSVEYCRKGKGPNPPQFLVNPGNVLLTRFGSRGATPASVREKYDSGHEKLLAALAGVRDDEWERRARIYGNEYSIRSTFAEVDVHFREHEQDIMKGLGRT